MYLCNLLTVALAYIYIRNEYVTAVNRNLSNCDKSRHVFMIRGTLIMNTCLTTFEKSLFPESPIFPFPGDAATGKGKKRVPGREVVSESLSNN